MAGVAKLYYPSTPGPPYAFRVAVMSSLSRRQRSAVFRAWLWNCTQASWIGLFVRYSAVPLRSGGRGSCPTHVARSFPASRQIIVWLSPLLLLLLMMIMMMFANHHARSISHNRRCRWSIVRTIWLHRYNIPASLWRDFTGNPHTRFVWDTLSTACESINFPHK